MIRVVFFDAVGTLFKVRGSVGAIYSKAGRRHGLAIDPDQIEKKFRQAFRLAPPLAFPNLPSERLIAEERLWWGDRIRESFELGIGDSRCQKLLEELFQIFSGEQAWEIFPEVTDTLEQLKKNGCRIGVISNFDSRLPAILEKLKLRQWIDFITWSSQVGVEKPAPRIFLTALAAAGVTPVEAVHVGNELEADVHGSLAAGLRGILVDRERRAPEGTGIEVIHDLTPLKKIISSQV